MRKVRLCCEKWERQADATQRQHIRDAMPAQVLTSTTTTSKAFSHRSLPGPKSGQALCVHYFRAVDSTDRGPTTGVGGPKLCGDTPSNREGKKVAGEMTVPVTRAAGITATTGHKRSFKQAQHRCLHHPLGSTMYKGKRVRQSVGAPHCHSRHLITSPQAAPASLSGFLWGEIKAFLGGDGLQYDFIVLQETHCTSFSAFQVDQWMAVGSATKRGKGYSRWCIRSMMPPWSATRRSFQSECYESKCAMIAQRLKH